MAKTMNEALKDVFLSLGGNPSELSDNQTVSDYIEDLGSAIKAEASSASEDMIDDETASDSKTFSSNKILSILPGAELPEVTEANNGQVLAVSGGEWKLCTITATANTETGAVTFSFTPVVAET